MDCGCELVNPVVDKNGEIMAFSAAAIALLFKAASQIQSGL